MAPRIDIVTIFPDYFQPLELSLIGKAQADGLVEIAVHDLRQFTTTCTAPWMTPPMAVEREW